MKLEQAVEIRERARALGLECCCDRCREALSTLSKLGIHESGSPAIIPPSHEIGKMHTKRREPVLGRAVEDAARWLRSQIGAVQ